MCLIKFNFNVQAMSKFIAASRQATELDKTKILLEKRMKEVKEESKVLAEVAAKAKEEATDNEDEKVFSSI